MHRWPVNIPIKEDGGIALEVFGQELSLSRVHPTTLSYSLGEGAATRLVAVSENANIVRFVPTLGERALLIFPRSKLLCPAGLSIRVVFALPVHLHLGVGTEADMRLVDDIAPPTITRSLYGPVDAGLICTSVRAIAAMSINQLRDEASDECAPELRFGEDIELADIEIGDDPQMSDAGDELPQSIRNELVAYMFLRVHNTTELPLEVSKVMVPINTLSLYQTRDYLLSNEIHLRLLSRQEAEISSGTCPDVDGVPIDLGQGRFAVPDRRPHLFAYAYRSKTGLDYGF
ncbi:MAG: hypothetical protein H0U74_02430 [Bradymonadaceae bacterium]|nr:hypothetical protein [Lujinxingiaceae bacterium]